MSGQDASPERYPGDFTHGADAEPDKTDRPDGAAGAADLPGRRHEPESADPLERGQRVPTASWEDTPAASWPDAPEPDWGTATSDRAGSRRWNGRVDDDHDDDHDDQDHDDDDHDDHDDTSRVPAFDLGPNTESVVVDLTGPQVPVGAEPEGALRSPASGPGAGSGSSGSSGYAGPGGDGQPSRHAAPVVGVAGDAGEGPAGATAVPTKSKTAPDPAREPQFDIPPVPRGTQQNQAESLTEATILRSSKPRPQSGWRKVVLRVTGGRVNFGLSPADRRRADLTARARTPVKGCYRVAVISLKGGVGKTTTTAALGAMLAALRGDRVIAVDANPDRGTLIERVERESGATVRHLLHQRDQVTRYGDVRAFTSQAGTRLEVLASDADPSASMALGEQDYRDAVDTLERFYNLILTDCGTGLLHDAMRGVLGLANSLVVVSSASLDGARSASATLDWLEAHGREQLARDAVVVISSVRPGGGIVDVMQLEDHFAARCRAVVTIPYDPHLEAGGVLDLGELDETTMEAYRELAAAVGEGFAEDSRS